MPQPPDAERPPRESSAAVQNTSRCGEGDLERTNRPARQPTIRDALELTYAAQVDQRDELARIAAALEVIAGHITRRAAPWPPKDSER